MAEVISIEATLKNMMSEGLKSISESFKSVESSAKSAGEKAASSFDKVKGSADNSGSSVKNFLSNMLSIAGGVGVITVATDAFDFLKDSVSESLAVAKQSQVVHASLSATLKQTGAATGVTADMADKLAESLSNVTTFSSDTVLSGESIMATFDKVGKNTFPQAISTSLDLATKLGMSVPTAARLLGRALEDPAKGLTQLTRYGITLSATQKDQIASFMKVNDVADAQKIVLGALHSRLGDVAQAVGQTFTGRLDILNNKLEDVKIQVGNAVIPILTNLLAAVMPIVLSLADRLPAAIQTTQNLFSSIGRVLSPVVDLFQHAGAAGDALKITLGALTGIGVTAFIAGMVGAIIASIPAIGTFAAAWWGAASGVLAATWPIVAIGAAIGAVILVVKHWLDTNEGFRTAVQNLVSGALTLLHDAIVAITPTVKEVVKEFGDFVDAIVGVVTPVIKQLVELVRANMPAIQSTITTALGVIRAIWSVVWPAILAVLAGVWDQIRLVVGTAINVVVGIIKVATDILHGNWSAAWNDLKQIVSNEINLIKSVIGDFVGHIEQVLGAAWTFITNAASGAWSGISSTIGGFVHGIWTNIESMAGNIKNAILSPFESARDAIGGIMKAFANFGLSILNGDLRSITAFVNGFGSAIDFVAGKLGHPNLIPHIQAPQVAYLAKGTDSFDGGMAIVGEQGPELVTLPKGTKVMPANQTKATLAALHGSIPAFAGGIGDVLGDIVGWFTKGAGALVSTALSAAHINASLPGDLTALGSGALNILKNFAVSDIQGFLSAMQSSVTGNGVGGTAAGLLRGFPQFNQLALSDRNKDFDCVPTSLAAGATYLLGHLLSPVQLKDAVYGAGYTGGTSPGRFGSYLRAHGVGLGSIGGNGTSIVEAAIGNIKRGIPTAVSIPSAWNNAASQAPTHEVIFAGFDQRTNTLTAMNPWGGFWQSQNASWWMPRIRYGVGNPMTRLATGGLIPEPVMGIGLHSGSQYSLGERGPEYVSPAGYAGQPIVHNHNHIYIEGRELINYVGRGMMNHIRTVTQRKV